MTALLCGGTRRKERGSALIGTVVIGLIFLAALAMYAQWSISMSRGESHRLATQRALGYADSGVSVLGLWLGNPDLSSQLPVNGSSTTIPSTPPNGRVETTLYRSPIDTSLVDSFTTAYAYLQSGSEVDPLTGQHAQIAVINAKFRITSVSQFMAAVPGTLAVDYGTNVSSGIVYAKDLVLTTGTVLPNTQLATAWYYSTINSTAPQGVIFTGSPAAPVKLTYPPNFTQLDSSVEKFYSDRKSTLPLPVFEGTVPAAADSHIYFVPGDLQLASTAQPLTFLGCYVIFVTGSVYIHNQILAADANSWIAVLSENDIHLANDIPAGGGCSISGTYVANSRFLADGGVRIFPQQLLFTGGIVSYAGISLSSTWTSRQYTYATLNSPDLLLPNFSALIEYRVLRGKYDQ